MRTIDKGQIAMLKVELLAAEKGITICKPTIEGLRYDIIIDDNGKLKRVQVKYCDCKTSCSENSYSVNLRKVQNNSNKDIKLYTENEIDGLLVYLPVIDKVLWFDSKKIANKQVLTIRTDLPKRGHIKNSNMAEDYIW